MPLFPIQPRYTTMTLGMPNTQEMILVVNVEATRFSGKTTALEALEELGFAFFLLKFLLLMLAILFPLAVSVI